MTLFSSEIVDIDNRICTAQKQLEEAKNPRWALYFKKKLKDAIKAKRELLLSELDSMSQESVESEQLETKQSAQPEVAKPRRPKNRMSMKNQMLEEYNGQPNEDEERVRNRMQERKQNLIDHDAILDKLREEEKKMIASGMSQADASVAVNKLQRELMAELYPAPKQKTGKNSLLLYQEEDNTPAVPMPAPTPKPVRDISKLLSRVDATLAAKRSRH